MKNLPALLLGGFSSVVQKRFHTFLPCKAQGLKPPLLTPTLTPPNGGRSRTIQQLDPYDALPVAFGYPVGAGDVLSPDRSGNPPWRRLPY